MTPKDHKDYAMDLFFSLRGDGPEAKAVNFAPNPRQTKNAANAMTAILRHRLFEGSKQRPIPKTDAGSEKTFEWKQGIFNLRNRTDLSYFWTNMRPGVAKKLHDTAKSKPVAYLFAHCEPEDTRMDTWALPEPVLHDSLASLPFEEKGKKYTVEIRIDEQRIRRCGASPNLTPFYQQLQLEQNEMLLLKESREADASVKRDRKNARRDEESDDDEGGDAVVAETGKLLAAAEQRLSETSAFNPKGVDDARERVLSSIVRRRGQPAFRRRLLAAYCGRCAITGCVVEDVLEAAHIVPYRGPDTNHPANGLLLRTDLHTLFDLRLIAIDVETMTLLVSRELSCTEYEEYRGRPVRVPDDRESQPSREALNQHRHESRL